MDTGKICFNCFKENEPGDSPCSHCGYEAPQIQNPPHQLRCGSVLNGKYLIGRSLGQGGFGITYIGWDLNLELKIAVKEYYPEGFASREQTMCSTVLPHTGRNGDFFTNGRDKFVDEAKILAKFTNMPGVVNVRDYFTANGTAYIVMEFLDGRTLKQIMRERGKIPAPEVLRLLAPIFNSLEKVHASGLLHRDISPDNIIVSSSGGAKLLDFGAARQFSTQGEKSNTVNVKHGFAPEEQYRTRGEQGPWTDIYALCATIYALTTGSVPPQALDRLAGEEIALPNTFGAGFTQSQQDALMRGLSVKGSDRQQTIGQLFKEMYEGASAPVSDASSRTYATPAYPNPAAAVSQQPGPYAASSAAPPPAPKNRAATNRRNMITVIASAVGGVALLVIVMVAVFAGNSGDKTDAPSSAQAATVLKDSAMMATPSPTPTPTPTPAPTQTPTPMTDYPSTLYLSTDYVTMGYGQTVDIYIEVLDPPDNEFYLTYEIDDDSIVSASWDEWYDDTSITLWLTCEGTGETYIDIYCHSEDESEVFGATTIYVTGDADVLMDTSYLESMLYGYSAGVEIIDVTRDYYYSAGIYDESLAASALINIPILYTSALYVDYGSVALSDGIMFNYTQGGRGGIPASNSGNYLSLDELLKNMLLYSDNNASNSLLDFFGVDTINDTCYESGFDSVYISEYLGSGYDNYVSVDDVAWMLWYLWTESQSIGKQYLADNMWILDGNARIGLGYYLPEDSVFMNHNGFKDGVYSEAAIVTSGNETYIVVFIGNGGTYTELAELASYIGDYIHLCLG